jgi:hypothetical protein
MTFPHVSQSSRFFNMFILLYIGQKLHTQFLKFLPPLFFMVLQVFKEKSKKMNMQSRKDDFQPILNCFIILKSLKKFLFKKLID